METKDIKKLWTIQNGSEAETWVNVKDLMKYLDEVSAELETFEIEFEKENLPECAERAKIRRIQTDSIWLKLNKMLK